MNKDKHIQESKDDLFSKLTGLINDPDSENSITISNYDDLIISANSAPSIDWSWNSSIISPIPSLTTDQINSLNQISIQPLTTDQINSLNQISIQPLTTGTVLTSPYMVGSNTGWGTGPGLNNTLEVKGDANFEGDIKIKGKSLTKSLEKIEEKLAILRPNEQLEEKWEQLRELRRQYIECEKDIIEKEKIWETLKK